MQQAVLRTIGGKTVNANSGILKRITTTDPAANAEVPVQTVTAGKAWELVSLTVQLVTDGTAATRQVVLTFDDGSLVFARFPAATTQAASLTVNYSFHANGQGITSGSAAGYTVTGSIAPGILLEAGYRITTATVNRQATDNFGVAELLVIEYDAL